MEIRVAKELLHIQHWLSLAALIVKNGKEECQKDEIAQEAGDSIMIKIGEAAKTLAAHNVEPPRGIRWSDAARNREKLAHHYSNIDREITWTTLASSLAKWKELLGDLFDEAASALDAKS